MVLVVDILLVLLVVVLMQHLYLTVMVVERLVLPITLTISKHRIERVMKMLGVILIKHLLVT